MEAHSTQTLKNGNTPFPVQVTTSELACVLKQAGLQASARSPLHNLPPADPAAVSKLVEKGFVQVSGALKPDIERAIRAMANPVAELSVEAGNSVVKQAVKLYASPAGPFTACTRLDPDSFQFSPAFTVADLLTVLLDGLNLVGEISDPGFRAELSTKGLLALSALIDALRQVQIRSLLNRNPNPELSLDFIDVWAALHRGIVDDDYRWLTTAVRSRLPDEIDVSQETLSLGLAELKTAGLAVSDGTSWTLADNHLALLTDLMTPLNFGSCFARSASDKNEQTMKLVLLRSPAALWALHFKGGSDKVSIFTLTVNRLGTLMAELAARLQSLATQSATPPPPPPVAPPVAGSEPPAAPRTRFCSSCGKPVTPADRFCPSCGQAL